MHTHSLSPLNTHTHIYIHTHTHTHTLPLYLSFSKHKKFSVSPYSLFVRSLSHERAYSYGKVAHLELSSHQISELNNRLRVRNTISQISQRLSLINQRCRRILYLQLCFHVFLYPCCLWMLIDAIFGFDQHSHANTFSLSVSPLPCFISLQIKGDALPQS